MVTKEALAGFFEKEFPQAVVSIESVGDRSATLRKRIGDRHLRPGGTVSGPVLMELADAALYAAILAEIGLVALAVTTSLTVNFLRKPAADKDVIAQCTLLKVGRSLVVGEVSLFSDGELEPVAHAVGTYSIPPKRTEGGAHEPAG
tara:strand:- start:10843 stop:11280 length:438 start_codon:yes stop_codon:yes gene_type:complete